MTDPARCVILVPVGGRIEPDCEAGLRELERLGHPVRRVHGYSAIDQARCQMASDALADGFDETMWIDADVAFDPADVAKLRGHGLPLCCGLYPKKGPRAFAANFLPGTAEAKFGRGGGLLQMHAVGFGFTHVRRETYARLREQARLPACNARFGRTLTPYFLPLVTPDPERPGASLYLAEDFAFCERARRAGIKIMADTTVRLWHVGPWRYGWEEAGRDPERYADYSFRIV